VRLCHAIDHLTELDDDLARIPPVASDWQSPSSFEAGARTLAAWIDATRDPEADPSPAVLKALEDSSKQLSAERKAGREQLLEDLALQRTPTTTVRASLDTLAWANSALYHTWRLAESLKAASGK
jgi:phosphate:Na+ symporter